MCRYLSVKQRPTRLTSLPGKVRREPHIHTLMYRVTDYIDV
jgi:hypothetical protein